MPVHETLAGPTAIVYADFRPFAAAPAAVPCTRHPPTAAAATCWLLLEVWRWWRW